jgi:hypothetical protein
MQNALDLTETYAIQVFDTVLSNNSGFEGVVTEVLAQDPFRGALYLITRTDTGADAILFGNELSLVKKYVGGFSPFQVSADTAERARNHQEAVNGKRA